MLIFSKFLTIAVVPVDQREINTRLRKTSLAECEKSGETWEPTGCLIRFLDSWMMVVITGRTPLVHLLWSWVIYVFTTLCVTQGVAGGVGRVARPPRAAKWIRTLNEEFDLLRSAVSKIMKKITGNSCDFLTFVISVRGGHCDYLGPKKPSCATDVTLITPCTLKWAFASTFLYQNSALISHLSCSTYTCSLS